MLEANSLITTNDQPHSKGKLMTNLFWGVGAALLALHGLVHLMGFFAYWPLLTLTDLPYKTTLLNGLLEIGTVGMRAYSVLWLAAALGFMSTGIAILLGWRRWQTVLLVSALLSMAITALDWTTAFRGALLDGVILLAFAYITHNSRLITLRGR